MFDRLLGLLGAAPPPVRETPSPQLATAVLLTELARADYEIPESERRRIAEILAEDYALDAAAVADLAMQAERKAQAATSLYDYVRVLNEKLEPPGKRALMLRLWQVAYADGRLDKYEESLMRKLADLLYVSDADFIRAKLGATGAG